MKITAVALGLAIAAAAGGTTVLTSTGIQSINSAGADAVRGNANRDSRICQWLGRNDSDSTVRLWFACGR